MLTISILTVLWFALPQTAPAPTLVVRGARSFDPRTGALSVPEQVWVEGERIVAHRTLDTQVPPGVQIVDGTGLTLLPGLFDLHAHVAVSGGSMASPMLLPEEDNLRSALLCGVTHVVDLHHGDAVFELRERSRVEPELARLYAAGAAFTAPGGHGTQFGIRANEVTAVGDVDGLFDALLSKKPDVIKAIVEHGGWAGLPSFPTLDEPQLARIGERAKRATTPLFVHVWTLAEAKQAARNGARALVHGVFIGEVDDELVRLMRERDVAYVPTLAVVLGAQRAAGERSPYARPLVEKALDPELYQALTSASGSTWAMSETFGEERTWFANLKKLSDAGVRIGIGTDAGNPLTPHGPSLLVELGLYVEAGLTPTQALRAATLGSAQCLGIEREHGTLAPGSVADLLLVRGDPTASIDAIWEVEQVIKAGRLVDRAAIARKLSGRATSPAKRAGKDLPARLDGFDDGDLECAWGGTWTLSLDVVTGQGQSTGELAVQNGALSLKGELKSGFPYGPWSGASVGFSADRRALVNAADFDGVRLRVRGTERTFDVTLHRAAVRDFDAFKAILEVEPDWTEVFLPFDSFRQIGFGKSIPRAFDDLTGVDVTARVPFGSNELGAFGLEVDWIEFAQAP